MLAESSRKSEKLFSGVWAIPTECPTSWTCVASRSYVAGSVCVVMLPPPVSISTVRSRNAAPLYTMSHSTIWPPLTWIACVPPGGVKNVSSSTSVRSVTPSTPVGRVSSPGSSTAT